MKLRTVFLLLMLGSKLPNISSGGKKNIYHKIKERPNILLVVKVTLIAIVNCKKIISEQLCEDEGSKCSQFSMYCSTDMIANLCKKTCGICKETSTGTSTTEETTNVEETSSTETPSTVAGIFFILQNHAFSKTLLPRLSRKNYDIFLF